VEEMGLQDETAPPLAARRGGGRTEAAGGRGGTSISNGHPKSQNRDRNERQKFLQRKTHTGHPFFVAPPILRSFPPHSILRLRSRTSEPSARHAPRVRPPPPPSVPAGRGPFLLSGEAARPRSPLHVRRWRSSAASASPLGRSAGAEEVAVPAEHSGHRLGGLAPLLGLRSRRRWRGRLGGGLRLGGGGGLIQHVELIDAVIVGVGDGASTLGTRPGWRPGWGQSQHMSSASASSMPLRFELAAPRRWRRRTSSMRLGNGSPVGVAHEEET
jgi:hypothetical protein